ncbi:isoaspartyl peptidase/L-asparaginase-like [Polistes fuscatus]|uniref:isoaspartyl peptidase/L-asparaginase-like n=1 Tax=Polistes fuscatus TaxID=30207 RepID=UPI001CA89347|nr:isoaspartyl peptidase/L-asparaginase-like [Polistes fuscatus]
MYMKRYHYKKNNSLKKKNEIDETFPNVICNKWEEKYICQRDTNSPCIIVHGGIGDCKDFTVIEKITACQKAASIGYKKLKNGGNSIEAVEAALWWLECDEFFNCGYGSVLNEIGQVQMDAGIMDGDKFECGSVAAVSDIEHPISLARYVLENLPNNIIVGESAKQLAQFANINLLSHGNMVAPTAYLAYKLSETGDSVADYNVEDLENIQALQSSVGTVGCVAWDGCSIAAGTTTGGLNRKMVGRVGDSPLLGCGTYADKNVGCSLTGHGESIIKLGMARRIADDINQGYDPRTALQRNLDYMLIKFAKNSGGIVLKKDGSWDIYFTYKRMPYAVIKNNEMIFGADLNERKTDVYKDLDANDFF